MATSPATSRTEPRAGGRRRTGALPNLVVIGAQKCGTSGLHYHLGLHPEIAMSQPKELNFFVEERNWGRGVDWYRDQFDARAPVRGESSPNYTAYPVFAGVPERMHQVVPDAKLLYIVRDPLERMAAHWVHNFAKRREKGDLRTTLTYPDTPYIPRSLYAMQLERYLEHYSPDQVLILDQQEDLRTQRVASLRRVFEFVGVDPGYEHPNFVHERHATAAKTRASRLAAWLARQSWRHRRLPSPEFWFGLDARLLPHRPIELPDVRAALPDDVLSMLRDDAERLRELTGRRFEHWSIWEP